VDISLVDGCYGLYLDAVNNRSNAKALNHTGSQHNWTGHQRHEASHLYCTKVRYSRSFSTRTTSMASASFPTLSTKSTFAHSRQNSQESTASGASYQLILEHILSYPNTYEIPLRTMYTLNCAPRAQPMSPRPSRAPSPTSSSSSPSSPSFPYDQQATTAQFTSALMDQISQLPSHPSSLPPTFVTSFVNRCFPVELELVDFPQSLTALDYLKDLETRRRKEIAHSFRTLNLDQSNLSPEMLHNLRSWNHAVADWVESLENKLRKVEALYTSIYISLRRWVYTNPFLFACHGLTITDSDQ
jgi:hypothetical protein